MKTQLPRYTFYLAMHQGQPSLIVEVPSMNKFKFVVRTAESFALLRQEYMEMKNEPKRTNWNVEHYVMPAAHMYMQQTNAYVG